MISTMINIAVIVVLIAIGLLVYVTKYKDWLSVSPLQTSIVMTMIALTLTVLAGLVAGWIGVWCLLIFGAFLFLISLPDYLEGVAHLKPFVEKPIARPTPDGAPLFREEDSPNNANGRRRVNGTSSIMPTELSRPIAANAPLCEELEEELDDVPLADSTRSPPCVASYPNC